MRSRGIVYLAVHYRRDANVNRVSLGPLNVATMLAAASSKATLVVLVFMHVSHTPSLTRVAVVGGLVWLAIMMAFVMSDYLSRGWLRTRVGGDATLEIGLSPARATMPALD